MTVATVSPLFAELHRWQGMTFAWGEADCCTVLADWVARVRGQDFMAHLRGLYDDPMSCERATGFLRDPVGAFERALATIGGLPRVDTPRAGDIAVLRRADSPLRPHGGLWTGTRWAGLADQGVTILRPAMVQPLAIWSVGYAA